jgi:1-acyl-sn-glycerol-3-phosphate acyltransferase
MARSNARTAEEAAESLLLRVLWTPINALQLLFTLAWSAVGITLALGVLLVTRNRKLPHAMARRIWAPGLLRGAGARLEVAGLERVDREAPQFFVANHQSIIDVPALFAALPVDLHFIVKKEIRRVPFLGWYVAAMGMIFVDRRSRIDAMTEVRRAAGLIRSGRSVVSFPEGTRSRDGIVGPFKAGAFVAAIEAGVPIVPVAILGAGGVLPAQGFSVRPGTIRVTVGDPIPTVGRTLEERGDLAGLARQRVAELYDGLRRSEA